MKIVLWIVGSVIALVCVLAQSITIPLGAPTPSLMRWPDGNPIRIGFGLGVTNMWLYVTNAGSGGGGGGLSNLTAGIMPVASSATSLTNSGVKAGGGHLAIDSALPDIHQGSQHFVAVNIEKSLTTNENVGYYGLNINLFKTNNQPFTGTPYLLNGDITLGGTNDLMGAVGVASGVGVHASNNVGMVYNGSFRTAVTSGIIEDVVSLFGYTFLNGGTISDIAVGGLLQLHLAGDSPTTISPAATRLSGGMMRVKHVGGNWDHAAAGMIEFSVDDSGTLTNSVGLHILSALALNSATMETFIGLQIDDQTAATDNNIAIQTGKGLVNFGDQTTVNVDTAGMTSVGELTALSTTTFINAETTFEAARALTGGLVVYGLPFDETTELLGIAYDIIVAGTNSYPFTIGLRLRLDTIEDCVVTNSYGIYVESTDTDDASVIQNFYGIKIADQTAAGVNIAIETGLGAVNLGDAVTLSHTLSAHTNIAPFTLLTNAVVTDTLYTNRNQRATVYQAYNMTSALLSAAALDLYVDDDGNGTWDSIGLGLAAPGGVTNVLKQILSFPLQPGARYAVSNSSGASSTVAAAGPSRIVFQ